MNKNDISMENKTKKFISDKSLYTSKQLESPIHKNDKSIENNIESAFNRGTTKVQSNIFNNEGSLNSSYISSTSMVQDVQGLIS